MLDDFQLQRAALNLLVRAHNSAAGANFTQLNAGIQGNEPKNEITCSFAGFRKRSRQGEVKLTRECALVPTMDLAQLGGGSPLLSPQTTGTIPSQIRYFSDNNRLSSFAAATTGRGNPLVPSNLSEKLSAQFMKHGEEIEQLIKRQGERMEQELEEGRQRFHNILLTIIEQRMLQWLKQKESDLVKMNHRNFELEERAKRLILELQFWQNLAKSNELVASNLRTSLEQAVAQTKEQSREGYGESEVDDAESCRYGDAGDVHIRALREKQELEQNLCKVCQSNTLCILLLPCRHLCVCKDCENRLDKCPLCKCAKNGSVEVYMS